MGTRFADIQIEKRIKGLSTEGRREAGTWDTVRMYSGENRRLHSEPRLTVFRPRQGQ